MKILIMSHNPDFLKREILKEYPKANFIFTNRAEFERIFLAEKPEKVIIETKYAEGDLVLVPDVLGNYNMTIQNRTTA